MSVWGGGGVCLGVVSAWGCLPRGCIHYLSTTTVADGKNSLKNASLLLMFSGYSVDVFVLYISGRKKRKKYCQNCQNDDLMATMLYQLKDISEIN